MRNSNRCKLGDAKRASNRVYVAQMHVRCHRLTIVALP